MFFLDELDNLKMYRRNVLLPINEKDKRHGCLAYLFAPTKQSIGSIMKSPFLFNRYYNSYYIERAVMRYINQEGATISTASGEVVTEEEKAMLFDKKEFKVKWDGFSIHLKEPKKYLKSEWFIRQMEIYKIDKRKMPMEVPVIIKDEMIYTTRKIIHLQPMYRAPSEFRTYENYCKFNGYMWLFFNCNRQIDPWVCMAAALKECGVTKTYKYREDVWKFNTKLMYLCKAMDKYEEANSRTAFINDIIKGPNGEAKLGVSIADLVHMLGDDLRKNIEEVILGESIERVDPMEVVLEDGRYNTTFKKSIYDDRIKTNTELKEHYEKIKEEFSDIKYTYNDISMYKALNLFVDLSSYNESFIYKSHLTNLNGMRAYCELMKRLLNDQRFTEAGYNKQTIIIPVNEWMRAINAPKEFHLISKTINPISCIYYALTNTTIDLNAIFGDRDVLFLGDKCFTKVNFSKIDRSKTNLFLRLMKTIVDREEVFDPGARVGGANKAAAASPKAIKMDIVDSVEKNRKIKIDDISDDEVKPDASEDEKKKKELVKAADKAAKKSNNTDEALNNIDNDAVEAEKIKSILSDLATSPDDRGSNISGARASRLLKLQNDFLDSTFEGRSVKDIINTPATKGFEPVKPVSLDIDSINPEWKELGFAATMDSYDLDADIVRVFSAFADMSNPLVVRDISREDTSTSNDIIWTYTCKYEDAQGKRHTIKVDIPRFIDNKYMVLRGNRKNIPIQLLLMPIIKTSDDAVQIVSSYKKIFVYRFGTTRGKSNVILDKLFKAINKGTYKHLSYTYGDNTKVCAKYELPIDYIDIAGSVGTLSTPKYKFYFNQDELRKNYEVDDSKGLCFGVNKKTKELLYYKPDPKNPEFFSSVLYNHIEDGLEGADKEEFINQYDKASQSVRHTYSRASVLDTYIPIIVICGLAEGLESTLKKANIEYTLHEKRPKINKSTHDIIRFKDGFLVYKLDYASSLLMNGLKACPTDTRSITEINSRLMYIEFLDNFGGRINADGLDNFQDCMIDPITMDTLVHYNLPTDYVSILLHCNMLLADNKYVKHGDVRSTRRARRIEQIAALTYNELSSAYGRYSYSINHGKDSSFSVKQSAVIDALLKGNTTEDQSTLSALLEYETMYAITPKGQSGLNSDRAYSLDKRSFDESMTNVMSASTGFAGNVGINRQATIDANITGTRGYIYNDPGKINEINPTKTLCMTEALIPWCSTKDDPMRLAMGYVQTMKHSMRCDKSDPLLITTGADEALPYLVSNTFAHKARGKGKVVEIVEGSHMIIEYDNPEVPTAKGKGKFEYINLDEEVEKNSSSGFYISLKLDTDLKVGSRVKEGQIVAYDKQSFSSDTGATDNLAYNIGCLTKLAILATDEGYEDSAIVSEALSERLASDVVYEKEYIIPKDANIFDMVEKGQEVAEGQSLVVLQNAYDDEDITAILKHLSDDEEGVTELGKIPIKSKVAGIVQKIVIERTVDIDELSPTLKAAVNKFERGVNAKKAIMKKYGIEDTNKVLHEAGKLPATGRLKKAADSVSIRFYIKTHEKFAVGCKMVYGTALKGVNKGIIPEGEEPYSEYRKDEKIHTMLACGSVHKRMVGSAVHTAGINKVMVELSRKVKEMAGIPYDLDI